MNSIIEIYTFTTHQVCFSPCMYMTWDLMDPLQGAKVQTMGLYCLHNILY